MDHDPLSTQVRDTAIHSGENKEPIAMNQCLLRFQKKKNTSKLQKKYQVKN